LARQRQRTLRKQALRLGKHIYDEPADDFVGGIVAGWNGAALAARPATVEGGLAEAHKQPRTPGAEMKGPADA
jgi:hypothetical protein